MLEIVIISHPGAGWKCSGNVLEFQTSDVLMHNNSPFVKCAESRVRGHHRGHHQGHEERQICRQSDLELTSSTGGSRRIAS
jgi:hypothetical protein